jgi:hypothetical protein
VLQLKVVEHATIDDLFVGAISEARKQFKVKNRIPFGAGGICNINTCFPSTLTR